MTARHYYAVTLGGYLGLFLLLLAWNSWLAPSQYFPRALVLLVLVGPLLFPLRGLLHGKPYTFAWSSYLALFYFTYAVGEAFANPGERGLAVAAVVFSVTWFVGAILYARRRGRELKQHAES